jgi:iron complex outermembrane recepter protein
MTRSTPMRLPLGLMALGLGLAGWSGAQQAQDSASGDSLGEIVVTAQKRAENLRDVPISISVLEGSVLEQQHVQGFDAITRMTPGVSFSAGAGEGAGEGQETIEIRGVSSNVGAATVGIYFDESPVTLPGEVGMVQPKLFDLERIEILRGPQGTLYGSSSEGGTLRYISRAADPTQASADTSVDGSDTDHGGGNYDLRAVFNQPLIDNVLAIRFGVQYDHQSGWIDRYAHPPGYTNLDTSTGQLLGSGVNKQHDLSLKLAATWLPAEGLSVTPQFYFQRTKEYDQPAFFLGQGLYAQENSVEQPVRDSFFLSSLKIVKELPFASLTSNTSWFWKDIFRQADGTYYDPAYVVPYILDPALPAFQPKADQLLSSLPTTAFDEQSVTNWVQELRLAHRPGAGDLPLTWVTGLYFSYETYLLQHREVAPGWNQLFEQVYGFSPDSAQSPVSALSSNPADNFPDLWANDQFQHNRTERRKAEYAVFGQADYDLTSRLHAGVGLRYDWTRLPYERYAGGFFNVGNPTSLVETSHDHAITPKFSVKFDTSELTNIYASAAKGFRVGGVNNPVPEAICAYDYKYLGISPEPSSYSNDHLWTYELGAKAALLNQSMSVNTAIYETRWNDIQQQIELPFCGYAYVSNVGDAEIKGAELELRYKIPQLGGFIVGLSGDVQNAKFTSVLPGSPASVGQHVLYTPEWNATVTGDYAWPVNVIGRLLASMMVGAFRLPVVIEGMIEESTTRSPSRPMTRPCGIDHRHADRRRRAHLAGAGGVVGALDVLRG